MLKSQGWEVHLIQNRALNLTADQSPLYTVPLLQFRTRSIACPYGLSDFCYKVHVANGKGQSYNLFTLGTDFQ